jgi:hypothetical protein
LLRETRLVKLRCGLVCAPSIAQARARDTSIATANYLDKKRSHCFSGNKMNLTNSIVLSLIMVAAGLLIYFMGTRQRSTLAVPLISNHGKLVAGGTLILVGLCIAAFVLLKHLR